MKDHFVFSNVHMKQFGNKLDVLFGIGLAVVVIVLTLLGSFCDFMLAIANTKGFVWIQIDNGWTRSLFREMVKFSSVKKILLSSDSASNITPMLKFWVACVLSVRRNRRKRGTDIDDLVYGESPSKSNFLPKIKVAADSPWKTVGP